MVRLSELLGRPVHTASGGDLGRVRDVVIGLGTGEHHPTARAVVTRDGAEHWITWDVIALDGRSITTSDTIGVREAHLADDELLLDRDVLDVQVVDIAGHRVARVGDVLFSDDVTHPEVAAVELGFAPVLERMGFRRSARRTRRDALDWNDIHLTSERGHAVQLAVPKSAIHTLGPEELAALLHRLDTESASEAADALDDTIVASALETAHGSTTERILRALPHHRAGHLLDHMSEPGARHWRQRLDRPRQFGGRRFFRTSGWRRHHRHGAR